jgi:sphingolipid delta-4 desaturase
MSFQVLYEIILGMNQYKTVAYPEPHIGRTKEILLRHPELKDLFGNTKSTAIYIFGIVSIQIAISYLLKDSNFWFMLFVAYIAGATFCHALWTLIHECTHNLVFKKSTSNIIMQIIANIPICYPAAISFRIFQARFKLF